VVVADVLQCRGDAVDQVVLRDGGGHVNLFVAVRVRARGCPDGFSSVANDA
jgi:hypothetical protein